MLAEIVRIDAPYHLRHLVGRANPFSDRMAIARLKCRFGSAALFGVVSTGSPVARRLGRSTTLAKRWRFEMPSGRPPVVRMTPTTERTWGGNDIDFYLKFVLNIDRITK